MEDWTDEEILTEAEYRIPRLIGDDPDVVEERQFWQAQLDRIRQSSTAG